MPDDLGQPGGWKGRIQRKKRPAARCTAINAARKSTPRSASKTTTPSGPTPADGEPVGDGRAPTCELPVTEPDPPG